MVSDVSGVVCFAYFTHEPRCEKNGLRAFRPGPTHSRLYNHTRWLEAWNFENRKSRDCTIYVAKTKAPISFAVTAKPICVFVFAYAKSRVSHDVAHIIFCLFYTLRWTRVPYEDDLIRRPLFWDDRVCVRQ